MVYEENGTREMNKNKSYKKGDTVKLKDDSIALVLDSGIKGKDFVKKYGGQDVSYVCTNLKSWMELVDDDWQWILSKGRPPVVKGSETVWYPVLIGDVKGWMELESLKE